MGKNNNKPKNIDPMSNSKTMSREGMKIIRNIAHGKYNIYTEGHIFRNLDFVNSIICEIDKRLLDVNIHIMAIRYAYSGTTDGNVLNLLHRDEKTKEAYVLIRQVLNNIVVSGGDTSFLWVLANKLPRYKYNI